MNEIFGAGGSPDPHTPIESPDSLRSKQTASFIDVLCEGEIVGLIDGFKSVYLNETPVVNDDGTYNFQNVSMFTRQGTVNQDPVQNMTDTQFEIPVAVEVKAAVPVTRTVNQANVKKIRVTVAFPALTTQDVNNGDLKGADVSFQIWVQSAGGGFKLATTPVVSGKTTSRYQRSYVLPVDGPGPWDIRVTRLTPDATNSAVNNKLIFESMTGIIPVQLAYPNTALVAMNVDAANFNSIPSRAYLIKGLIVRIPSNYDPVTRAYNGIWDGNFSLGWSDNPAWCYYDMLTNPRYGLGQWLKPESVDKWSLYNIAKYCDQLVPDGKGGTEPRFTCNLVLQSRAEAYSVIQNMASIFRAITFWSSGTIMGVQDRPSDPIAQFTAANVVDGAFTYSGSSMKGRHTVALVSWNDPTDFYRQKIEYVQDDELIRTYGIIEAEVAGFGCSSQSQAHRMGRWLLATERYVDETISFRAGLDGLMLFPGAVIQTTDPNRAGSRMGGRILGVTTGASTQSLRIDGSIDYTPGHTYQLSVITADGKLAKANLTSVVVNADGSTNLVPAAPFLPEPVVGAIWVLTDVSVLVPELWRITAITEGDPNTANVTAVRYVADLYDGVEKDINIVLPPITTINARPPAPINMAVAVSHYRVDSQITGLRVLLSWTSNTGRFRVSWRRDGGQWMSQETLESAYEINNVDPVSYDFMVVAIAMTGRESAAATLTTDLSVGAAGAVSYMPAPANLRLLTPYVRSDAVFAWDAVPGAVSYEVQIGVPGATFTPIRTWKLGDALRFTYSPDDMKADGGPFRSIVMRVRAYGVYSKLGEWATLTVGNPQVGALNGVTVTPGIGTIFFQCDTPTDADFAGIMVWMGTASNFTPNASNLVYEGSGTYAMIGSDSTGAAITDGGTYYVRCGGYDAIGKDNMTISGSTVVTVRSKAPDAASIVATMIKDGALTATKFASTIAPVGLVPSLPAVSGYTGPRVVFNTTDNKMYRFTGTAWTTAIPTTDLSGQITGTQITDNSVSAAKIVANTITANQIAAGAITANELAANSVIAGKIAAGSISATELKAGAITTDILVVGTNGGVPGTMIKDGAISTAKIATGAISADKMDVNYLYAGDLNANQLKAGTIAGVSMNLGGGNFTVDALGNAVMRSVKIIDQATGKTILQSGGIIDISFLPSGVQNSTLLPSIASATISTFSALAVWDFSASANGWTTRNITVTPQATYLTAASNAADPVLVSPANLNFPGVMYDKVRARIRRTAGTGWDGSVYFDKAPNVGEVNNGRSLIPTDPTVLNQWTLIEWDMATVANWATSTIEHIRVDLGLTAADAFDIDWIGVGRYAPPPTASDVATAATTASWGGVTGTGKPADNATVGPADAATSLGFNPQFSDWTGNYPAGWSAWAGPAPTKSTSVLRTPPYAVRWTVSGNTGMGINSGAFTAPAPAGTFVSGAYDINIVTNNGGGTPGILVRLFTNAALTDFDDTPVGALDKTALGWQRVPFSARTSSAARRIYGIQIYQMAAWTGMPGGLWADGSICIFDNLTFDFHDSTVDNNTLVPSITAAATSANWTAVAGRPQDPQNLVLRGSFEDGVVGDWSAGSVANVTGQTFTKAINTAQRDTYENAAVFPVVEGETFYIDGWVNTLGVPVSGTPGSFDAKAGIGLAFYNAAGSAVGFLSTPLARNTAWTKVSGSIVAPVGAIKAVPWLQINLQQGTDSFGSGAQYAGLRISRFQSGATVGAPAGTLVAGVAASTVATVATNFNASNDRNATAVAAPTILADGTAVDHTIRNDGAADVSFEWAWAGAEGDIDGFLVYVYQATSSAAYAIGTTPAAETVYTMPASKRAFIIRGVDATQYMTFGVQAYRSVDKDVNATGVIKSAIVKPSLAAENPYRPSATVAFNGDITGTINGVNTNNLNVWSAITGTGKPADNATVGAADAATTMGFNPQFSDWTGVCPTGWTTWGGGTNPTKSTSVFRTAPYGVRWAVAGNTGMVATSSFASPAPAGTFVSGAYDINIITNNGGGSPGILFRLFTNAALTDYDDTMVIVPNKAVTGWQRVPFTARTTSSARRIYGVQVYQMASYGGMPDGAWADGSVCVFDNLTFDFHDASVDNNTLVPSINAAATTANWTTVTNRPADDAIKNNLIDLSWWKRLGTSPWPLNGASELNMLYSCSPVSGADIFVAGPKGSQDVVWCAVEQVNDGDKGGGWDSAPIVLDPTKTYRFMVPVRRMSGSGYAYWGPSNVAALNGTAATNNPYFCSSNGLASDRWYLLVGYIYPAGSIGNTSDSAGIWDCKLGTKVGGGVNFNFLPGNGSVLHRAYQYYASNGAQQLFGRPMVNLIDGTEPSMREYFEANAVLNNSISVNSDGSLNGAGTGKVTLPGIGYTGDTNATYGAQFGYNIFGQMTKYNVTTYIASSAIGLALIDTASIGQLSALTADVGLLRTASSGARVEITANVITGYRANGTMAWRLSS